MKTQPVGLMQIDSTILEKLRPSFAITIMLYLIVIFTIMPVLRQFERTYQCRSWGYDTYNSNYRACIKIVDGVPIYTEIEEARTLFKEKK